MPLSVGDQSEELTDMTVIATAPNATSETGREGHADDDCVGKQQPRHYEGAAAGPLHTRKSSSVE